jgi:hypothetical protein
MITQVPRPNDRKSHMKHKPSYIHCCAVAFMACMCLPQHAMAEEHALSPDFIATRDELIKSCAAEDAAAFSRAYPTALLIATNGIGDTSELKLLFELLSGYFALSKTSAKEEVYAAWYKAIRSTIEADPAASPGYPIEEMSSFVHVQSEVAQLLLRRDGIGFPDQQQDKSKIFLNHLRVIGQYLHTLTQKSIDRPAGKEMGLYDLSAEAEKALSDHGEMFMPGSDLGMIKHDATRALVQRDISKNRLEMELSSLAEDRRKLIDDMRKETIYSVRAMVAQRWLTNMDAAKALATPSIPKARWIELINE